MLCEQGQNEGHKRETNCHALCSPKTLSTLDSYILFLKIHVHVHCSYKLENHIKTIKQLASLMTHISEPFHIGNNDVV